MTAYPESYLRWLAAGREPEELGADGRPSLYRMVDDLCHWSEGSSSLHDALSPSWIMRRFGKPLHGKTWCVPTLEVDGIRIGLVRIPAGTFGPDQTVTVSILMMHHATWCEQTKTRTERRIFDHVFDDAVKPVPGFLPAIQEALAEVHLLHAGGSLKLNHTPHYWERYHALHERAADSIRAAGALLIDPLLARWTHPTGSVDLTNRADPASPTGPSPSDESPSP